MSTLIFGLSVGVMASGCGEASREEASTEAISPLSDPSGSIHTTIIHCPEKSYPIGEHTAYCDFGTPSNFSDPVLVGGGAQLVGEAVPGALLTNSYPQGNPGRMPTTWTYAAKDHMAATGYTLAGAAIGLTITDINAVELRNYVHLNFATSAAGHLESVTVNAPGDEVVLGGGASCLTTPPALNEQLLVASKPYPDTDASAPTGWTAICKDHDLPSIGKAIAYVVSIPRHLKDKYYTSKTMRRDAAVVATAYDPLYFTAVNAAVTGVGGWAKYDYPFAGRLLTSIWPDQSNAFTPPTTAGLAVDSKDHNIKDGGQSIGYMIILSRN